MVSLLVCCVWRIKKDVNSFCTRHRRIHVCRVAYPTFKRRWCNSICGSRGKRWTYKFWTTPLLNFQIKQCPPPPKKKRKKKQTERVARLPNFLCILMFKTCINIFSSQNISLPPTFVNKPVGARKEKYSIWRPPFYDLTVATLFYVWSSNEV